MRPNIHLITLDIIFQFSSVQSVMSNSLWPHEPQDARFPCLSPTPRVYPNSCPESDAIQPSHPLSSPSPAFNLSQHQGLFKWISSSHPWPKYWSFSFNISLSSEHSGLISFRMDWLDLLSVQGTPKSLLQHLCKKRKKNQMGEYSFRLESQDLR